MQHVDMTLTLGYGVASNLRFVAGIERDGLFLVADEGKTRIYVPKRELRAVAAIINMIADQAEEREREVK